MTGFGEASSHGADVAVAVEVRTVNNRYFKLALRVPEGFAQYESAIESVTRRFVRRGTVNVTLRVHHSNATGLYRINTDVLAAYVAQLRQFQKEHLGQDAAISLEPLLQLPGVAEEGWANPEASDRDWPLIESCLSLALERMTKMRRDEGQAMCKDLLHQASMIESTLSVVEARAPEIVETYRKRLEERVRKALEEADMGDPVTPADLIREVSIYADRCDVSEEVVRLKSHLHQYRELLSAEESSGRKLEFLSQEMFREINTIGSKGNDLALSRAGVEIKAALERVREMIQNVE